MNAKSLLIFLIVAASIPHLTEAQGHRVMTATIDTESGTRNVEIRYYAGSEEWAEDVFRTIREGFPLLEKKIGIPCPVSWDILVVETTSLEKGVGGVNKGPLGLLVPTDTSTTVIIHELCHYWFGNLPSLQWSGWILEGFPEAYTIEVLRELDHPEGYSHWYSRLDQYEWAKSQIGEKPLGEVGYAPDFTDPRVGMLYSKAMVFSRWLLLYIDEESMQKINEEVIFDNSVRSEDYQEIAETITGEDLDWLFSGWVYPGDYYYEGKKVSFDWFAGDGDKDGIDTLDEIAAGSSPFVGDTDRDGLSDGYEMLLGTDPENADTDGDGLKDGEEVPIIIDGRNTEWKTPLITDDEGDSKAKTPEDIKALYYAADNTCVYFMIEYYSNPTTAFHNGIQIDVDGDEKTDFILFTVYNHLHLSIWEDGEWVETVCDPSSLQGTFIISDKVLEFRIPKRMRDLKFPKTFTVWTYELSVEENAITDKTTSKTVSLDRNLPESVNPRKQDTDNDGIKDGDDPDPLSAEPVETPEPTETPAPSESAPEETSEPTAAAPSESADTLHSEETPEPGKGTQFPTRIVLLVGGAVAAILIIVIIIRKAF